MRWHLIVGQSPDWTAVVTALSTLGLAIGAALALGQIGELRKSRHAQTAADFSRRWDETEMLASRQLSRQSPTPDDLRDAFMAAWADASKDDYLRLQIVPNYFEDLAILLNVGAIDVAFVQPSLGDVLCDTWERWRPAADAWSERAGRDPWPNFRKAATTLGAQRS